MTMEGLHTYLDPQLPVEAQSGYNIMVMSLVAEKVSSGLSMASVCIAR